MSTITENVRAFYEKMPEFNPYGEKVTLLAAVKTQPVEAINEAIEAGITDIGDNHAQEFRDKYGLITGNPKRHFIGHMQTNKVKYLTGKVNLYQSVDSVSIAEYLSQKSAQAGVTSDILLEINAGNEDTKGGFSVEEFPRIYETLRNIPNLRIEGIMAMLPASQDETLLRDLATKIRGLYDGIKKDNADITVLSMGMSGDWKICVDCGSNMIRIGTALFGKRTYNQ
ncbi:MAG: YggS family pyridoxal phosphate-dependent enzyme [Clostridia bacterium]|nr:YggS family pyridoxal phosphate-dependent enzyme [Clostridia bacterium]